MVDVFTVKKRSEVMSLIKSKDTKPEMIVRKYFHKKGLRYRLHCSDMPGKPDMRLKKYNVLIFVNGCFWHGHKNCKIFRKPKSNKKYWRKKIDDNINRDKKNIKLLKKDGWRIFVIWECKITRTPNKEKHLENIIKKIKPVVFH